MRVDIIHINKTAPTPTYATTGSAGVDLYAAVEMPQFIGPGEVAYVPTGVCIHMGRSGLVGLLFPRSGLACNDRICLANGVGVIDSDYQDQIIVCLENRGADTYIVEPDDRIAQIVFLPNFRAVFNIVENFDHLTNRGGFGRSGR